MPKIEKVGVIGCGLMGHGIAQLAAEAECRVAVREVDEEALSRGIGRIERQLARSVEKERMSREEADAVRDRIDGTTDYGALGDCDLIIEAITEELDSSSRCGARLIAWPAA